MNAKQIINCSIVFVLLQLAVSPVSAQNLDIPPKEFALSFSKNQLQIPRGETSEIDVLILKSKECQGSKVKMSVSSILPKGVTVTFSPEKGNLDSSKANISIQPDAAPGDYSVILSATLNYKTKGMILKLFIQ